MARIAENAHCMDGSLPVLPLSVLQAALRAAFERWMVLCELTARSDGIAPEELQRELDWLRSRSALLVQRSTPQQMRQLIADLQNAESWVHASLRLRMQALPGRVVARRRLPQAVEAAQLCYVPANTSTAQFSALPPPCLLSTISNVPCKPARPRSVCGPPCRRPMSAS
jgi:hypothetical protein